VSRPTPAEHDDLGSGHSASHVQGSAVRSRFTFLTHTRKWVVTVEQL
jgi:hypothetical protein